MVSHDSIVVDGETSVQCCEREARNTDRQRHRNEEAKNAAQAARGGPPPLAHNLQQEFLMVDNQQVEQTASTNLAVATHELARLPQTPEILKIQALLKAAQAQVNAIQNWMWPPVNWLDSEAISVFTRGLHHRQGLCSKLYHKRPQTIGELQKVANSYADSKEADQ